MIFEATGQEVPFNLVSSLMWVGVGVGGVGWGGGLCSHLVLSICSVQAPQKSLTVTYEAVLPGSEETRAASLSADPILIELVYFRTIDLIILHPDKASPAPTWPGWM